MDSGPHSMNHSDSLNGNMDKGDNGCSTCPEIQCPNATCDSVDDICVKCSDSGARPCSEDCFTVCADDCWESICFDSCDPLGLPGMSWEDWACFDPNCAQSDGMVSIIQSADAFIGECNILSRVSQ